VILADTSVWVDHLRRSDPTLASYLNQGLVLMHPFVVGEIALGNLRQRRVILDDLLSLPRTAVASEDEVLMFIEQHRLPGVGIGWVDAHLLAAVHLTPDSQLWTRDKRLRGVAARMGSAVGAR